MAQERTGERLRGIKVDNHGSEFRISDFSSGITRFFSHNWARRSRVRSGCPGFVLELRVDIIGWRISVEFEELLVYGMYFFEFPAGESFGVFVIGFFF